MNTTGFPSPAQGYEKETFDFNSILLRHPAATFCMRYTSSGMSAEGILPGDILIVDCAVQPQAGHLAVIETMQGDFRCVMLLAPEYAGGPFQYESLHDGIRPVQSLFGMITGIVRQYP